MPTELRVGLFEAEPDLARPLSADEREQAGRIRLSALELEGDLDPRRLLEEAHAFGMLVYEGMLLHRLRLGEHEQERLPFPNHGCDFPAGHFDGGADECAIDLS